MAFDSSGEELLKGCSDIPKTPSALRFLFPLVEKDFQVHQDSKICCICTYGTEKSVIRYANGQPMKKDGLPLKQSDVFQDYCAQAKATIHSPACDSSVFEIMTEPELLSKLGSKDQFQGCTGFRILRIGHDQPEPIPLILANQCILANRTCKDGFCEISNGCRWLERPLAALAPGLSNKEMNELLDKVGKIILVGNQLKSQLFDKTYADSATPIKVIYEKGKPPRFETYPCHDAGTSCENAGSGASWYCNDTFMSAPAEVQYCCNRKWNDAGQRCKE